MKCKYMDVRLNDTGIKFIEISNRLLKAIKTLCNALKNTFKTIKQP